MKNLRTSFIFAPSSASLCIICFLIVMLTKCKDDDHVHTVIAVSKYTDTTKNQKIILPPDDGENSEYHETNLRYHDIFAQREEIIHGMKYHIWFTDETSTHVNSDGLAIFALNITKDSLECLLLRKNIDSLKKK